MNTKSAILSNFLVFSLAFSLFFLLFSNPVFAWYSGYSDWQYRKPITITENSGSTLTDYQVKLTIDTASLISSGKMNSDCSDMRFTDENDNPIPYWIESGCNSANTIVWVKVPSIPTNSQIKIYMYYGNPSATSESNQNEVCPAGTYSGRCLEYRETFEDETNGQSPANGWTCEGMQACWFVVDATDNYYESDDSDTYDRSGSWETDKGIEINNDGNGIFAYAKFQIAQDTGSRANFPLAFVDLNHGDTTDRITGYPYYSGYLGVSFNSHDNEIYVWRINSAGEKEVHSASVAVDVGTTYTTRVFYHGNEIKVEFNGANYTFTFTEGITEKIGYIGVGTENSVDDVYELGFGKYADPEPTYEIGSEETSQGNTAPHIIIKNPQNQTYYTKTINFTFKAYDLENSTFTLKVYLDENEIYSNTSYTNNTWIYLTQDVSDGTHNFTVFADDGIVNSTNTTIFTVKTIPYFINVSYSYLSQVYDSQNPAWFNVTVADENNNIQTVYLEANFSGSFINYTMSNDTLEHYFYQLNETLPAGYYEYRFVAVDSENNQNATSYYNYTIEKANSNLEITSSHGWILYQGDSTTISCSAKPGLSLILKFDGVVVSNPYSVSPSVGTHTVYCSISDTQNYTPYEMAKTLIVNPISSCLDAYAYKLVVNNSYDWVTFDFSPLVQQHLVKEDLSDVSTNLTSSRVYINLTNGYYLIVNASNEPFEIYFSNYAKSNTYNYHPLTSTILNVTNYEQIHQSIEYTLSDEQSGSPLYPPNAEVLVLVECPLGENYVILENGTTQFALASQQYITKTAIRVRYSADAYYSRQYYPQQLDKLLINFYVVDAYTYALDRIDFVMDDANYYNSLLQVYKKRAEQNIIITEGYFDASHMFSTYLMEDTDYYIRTKNPDGTYTDFGRISVVTPMTKHLGNVYIRMNPQAQLISDNILFNAFREGDKLFVVYSDKTNQTESVTITVKNENGTVLFNETYESSYVYVYYNISNYTNQSFWVSFSVNHEIFGNSPVTYGIPVLAQQVIDIGISAVWKTLFASFLTIGAAGLTTRETLIGGSIVFVSLIGFFYAVGWLNLTAIQIVFIIFLVVLGIIYHFKEGGY